MEEPVDPPRTDPLPELPPAHEYSQGQGGVLAGRWTADEHELFLKGLDLYGREWKKIAAIIPTRTVVQIRTHAQKYFQRLSKEHHQHAHSRHAEDSDDSDRQPRKKSRPLTKIRAPSNDSQISAEAGGITPRTVAAASILLAPRHKGDPAAYLQSQANAAALLRRTSPRLSSSSPPPAWGDGV